MSDEHGGEQERDPPAPRLEVGVALDGGEHQQHAGREQVAQRHAGLRPRGPEAAAARRRRARRPSAPRRPTRRRRRSPGPAGRRSAGSARRRRWWRRSAAGRSRTCAIPIISSAMTSIFLRPIRSPKWPKTTPPSGRAANPTRVGAERAAASPSAGRRPGRTASPKTRAAAEP